MAGNRFAPLTFGLAAMRALEVGCVGIVLPSFPETAHIFEEMGAESRLSPVGGSRRVWYPS